MSETSATHDEQIRNAIVKALARDERTAVLGLRVGVLNGIAHLGGQAPGMKIRNLAERIVLEIVGVRGVVNRIDAPGAPSPSRTIRLKLKAMSNSAISIKTSHKDKVDN